MNKTSRRNKIDKSSKLEFLRCEDSMIFYSLKWIIILRSCSFLKRSESYLFNLENLKCWNMLSAEEEFSKFFPVCISETTQSGNCPRQHIFLFFDRSFQISRFHRKLLKLLKLLNDRSFYSNLEKKNEISHHSIRWWRIFQIFQDLISEIIWSGNCLRQHLILFFDRYFQISRFHLKLSKFLKSEVFKISQICIRKDWSWPRSVLWVR